MPVIMKAKEHNNKFVQTIQQKQNLKNYPLTQSVRLRIFLDFFRFFAS
jgi:hypothetical protein